MSGVEAVGSIAAPATANGFSDLSSEEFVKIIFTELSQQDPLEPNDSAALLDQLAQIRSIQSDLDLQTKLAALVSQNELASASTLIGRSIVGTSESGARVRAVVQSVSRTSDGPVLNVAGGHRVPLSGVSEIIEAPVEGGGA